MNAGCCWWLLLLVAACCCCLLLLLAAADCCCWLLLLVAAAGCCCCLLLLLGAAACCWLRLGNFADGKVFEYFRDFDVLLLDKWVWRFFAKFSKIETQKDFSQNHLGRVTLGEERGSDYEQLSARPESGSEWC